MVPPRKRRRAPTNPIEAAIRKSDDQFIEDYLRSSPDWTSWTHPVSGKPYALSLKSAPALAEHELQACFDLVERTSGADYRASRAGWKPLAKMKEMRSPELRYILVKEAPPAAADGGDDGEKATGEQEGRICGFTSLMPTFEEGEAVVYCYEIHLEEELRSKLLENWFKTDGEIPRHRTGMGRGLMGHLIRVAENIPDVEKVMLTCFVANAGARAFYERLGFERDATSPPQRTLRSGTVFVPDYVIMSRRAVRMRAGGGEETGDGKTIRAFWALWLGIFYMREGMDVGNSWCRHGMAELMPCLVRHIEFEAHKRPLAEHGVLYVLWWAFPMRHTVEREHLQRTKIVDGSPTTRDTIAIIASRVISI
ncbi:hypothetical protein LY76DRAFT_638733 [Colletotrichum caudatum]|nr:hypothetical protein LY76DRAFT_638733 [Colletotrichum caudatum]